MNRNTEQRGFFRQISLITLLAVYFLILVGGIVRSTGSGMGCPDWPKCFGSWIPPTDESELPDDYMDSYVEYRQDKNEKLADYLDVLGFQEKAKILRSDVSILEKTEFNSTKTWTEYVNRLVGVSIGILIIINLVASISYMKKDKRIFILSLLLLILVVFQGWIGSVVVSTNLLPWMVTVHMLLAVVIIGILIYLVFRSRRKQFEVAKASNLNLLNALLVISILFIIIQIIFGTQVREAIDVIAARYNFQDRDMWINEIGDTYIIHRSFSIFILASQLAIAGVLYKNRKTDIKLLNFTNILIAIAVLEVALGAIMGYFAIPAFVQPLHLLMAVGVFGWQLMLLLTINNYSVDTKNIR